MEHFVGLCVWTKVNWKRLTGMTQMMQEQNTTHPLGQGLTRYPQNSFPFPPEHTAKLHSQPLLQWDVIKWLSSGQQPVPHITSRLDPLKKIPSSSSLSLSPSLYHLIIPSLSICQLNSVKDKVLENGKATGSAWMSVWSRDSPCHPLICTEFWCEKLCQY